MSRRYSLLLPAVALATGTLSAAYAEDQPAGDNPPGRVGRISVIEGRMSLHNPDDDTSVGAEVNFPVTEHMEIVTDRDSRAEIELGGTVIALGGRTVLRVQVLDDQRMVLFAQSGSVDVRVRELGAGEQVAVATPTANAFLQETGAYRVDVANEGVTRIETFDGQAEVDVQTAEHAGAKAESHTLVSDQALEVNNGHILELQAEASSLEDWELKRENRLEASMSARYVSTDIPGYEDLDNAGTWQTTKTYGAVWMPSNLSSDWVPYENGHWSWVDTWGWTWIANESWGFAPFHYGRWVLIDAHWAWTPGKRLRHPAYMPAAVGFDGIDPSRFASPRQAPRRWVALGPGEIYRAPYSQDATYLKKVNGGMVATEALATATWETEEWPTFANIDHMHLSRTTAPIGTAKPRLATERAVDEVTPDGGVDSQGRMVLHIPVDEARRLNLVPPDVAVSTEAAERKAFEARSQVPDADPRTGVSDKTVDGHAHTDSADQSSSLDERLTHAETQAATPNHLTHPEYADRSGLVDPMPTTDEPARPTVDQEHLDAAPFTPIQPPLSHQVHQPPKKTAPAPKPQAKAWEKPADKAAENKPADKPAEKAEAKSPEKTAEKTAEKPAEKSDDKPAEKAADIAPAHKAGDDSTTK